MTVGRVPPDAGEAHPPKVGGFDMRKQDRIANQDQSRPQPQERDKNQERQDREQMKGRATETQPTRPPRQPGSKLPLPD